MSIIYNQQQEHLLPFSQTVIALRQRLRFTHSEFADRIHRTHQQRLVHAWEEGKAFPSRNDINTMSAIAFKHGWHDIAGQLKEAKSQHEWTQEQKRDARIPLEHAAKQNGRETAQIEVIHLIDEECASIRGDQRRFDGMIGKGMSVSDIVAWELDELKASIRALPVIMPGRRREHVRKHHA